MLEELQRDLQGTQNFLGETVEKVFLPTQDMIDRGKNSIIQGSKTVKAVGDSAINKIVGVAKTAREMLTDATNQSIKALRETADEAQFNLTETANQAISNVTETTQKAQASLNETIQNAEKLSNMAVEASQQAIAISVKNWLEAHPILAWLIVHPLLTLVVIFLFWLVLGGLFRAIARLSEQLWLRIFQFPFTIGQGLLRRFPKTWANSGKLGVVNPQSDPNYKEIRLSAILSRLEEIQQEQEALWQEMRTILVLDP